MTFRQCLMFCAETKELVENFDRLSGTSLAKLSQRTPLDAMIDEATGKEREEIEKFIAFVWEFVWMR